MYNSQENVLNSVLGIGIYIIKQDNYEILSFNKIKNSYLDEKYFDICLEKNNTKYIKNLYQKAQNGLPIYIKHLDINKKTGKKIYIDVEGVKFGEHNGYPVYQFIFSDKTKEYFSIVENESRKLKYKNILEQFSAIVSDMYEDIYEFDYNTNQCFRINIFEGKYFREILEDDIKGLVDKISKEFKYAKNFKQMFKPEFIIDYFNNDVRKIYYECLRRKSISLPYERYAITIKPILRGSNRFLVLLKNISYIKKENSQKELLQAKNLAKIKIIQNELNGRKVLTILSQSNHLNKEEIEYALESARLLSKRKRKPIFAKTFGNFDLFVNGKPIMFKSAKAKELLAFLIDKKGGTVTNDQIISILWADRENDVSTQNLCSKIVAKLKDELKKYKADNILEVTRTAKRVNADLIDCDYYRMLAGEKAIKKEYIGEYMSEYDWADLRVPILDKLKREE